MMRLLFCLPTTALSGGVKIVFELANRLTAAGHAVDVFSYAGPPRWFDLRATLLDQKDVAAVDFDRYQFVVVSNAFFVPLVLPRLRTARLIHLCQDYESFHHASGAGKRYADYICPSPGFDAIYRLPVPLIASSRPVAELIHRYTGQVAYTMQMAIDRTIFFPRPRTASGTVKRILFVGNYLMPYKGMADGLAALRMLAAEMPIQLVIATQESRGRALFDDVPFPVEVHYCAPEPAMPEILASCDVYCCTSWYEGLGLPALESFCCGVPVVSTHTHGVLDYGVDGENLLLCKPNDPESLYRQLRRLLLDDALAERLRQGGFRTVDAAYHWQSTLCRFREILEQIDRTYTGAGHVSHDAMQALLERLERDGDYTPISVFRRFQDLAAQLDTLTADLLAQGASTATFAQLEQLRGAFRAYLGNERAEYYDAFKAKYDLCGVLLSVRGNPRAGEYLQLLLARRQRHAAHAAATLSEIRYPER